LINTQASIRHSEKPQHPFQFPITLDAITVDVDLLPGASERLGHHKSDHHPLASKFALGRSFRFLKGSIYSCQERLELGQNTSALVGRPVPKTRQIVTH